MRHEICSVLPAKADIMTNEHDPMTEYLTRGEFHGAMKLVDQRFERIDERFERIDERFERLERRFDTFHVELLRDIASMLKSFEENMRAEFRALDDNYTDLPARVEKLEAAVFPAAPAKRARRRRTG